MNTVDADEDSPAMQRWPFETDTQAAGRFDEAVANCRLIPKKN